MKTMKPSETQAFARAGCEKAAQAAGCCGATPNQTEHAIRIGYTAEDVSSIEAGANLGLGCGNPTALAALRPGEIVLDLGSGAGFDALIAAPFEGSKQDPMIQAAFAALGGARVRALGDTVWS